MKIDRATINRLGIGCGAYNREVRAALGQEEYERTKAEQVVTNKTPIHRELGIVVGQYLQKVQDGELTMEKAALIINQLPAAEPVVSKAKHKSKAKKKPKAKSNKINSSLREQLAKIKLK